jgi:hypothetical protein
MERSILESKLRSANAEIDKALDAWDRRRFTQARGLRMQLLSRLAKTVDT